MPDLLRPPMGSQDVNPDEGGGGESSKAPFISCTPCRMRKVKCTGERPTCSKCERRSAECHYDSKPKRRGPDKEAGGRLKARFKKINRAEHVSIRTVSHADDPEDDLVSLPLLAHHARRSLPFGNTAEEASASIADQFDSTSLPSFSQLSNPDPLLIPPASALDEGYRAVIAPHTPLANIFAPAAVFQLPPLQLPAQPPASRVPLLPGIGHLVQSDPVDVSHDALNTYDGFGGGGVQLRYSMYVPPGNIPQARQGWWEWILDGFARDRNQAMEMVTQQCRTFFSRASVWSTFINQALFWRCLIAPSAELPRTPHVVLAILAHVTFLQAGHDVAAQFRAIRFADESRGIVEYSLLAGSKDPSIMQAAVLLTTFESYPHVLHTSNRWRSLIVYLDKCVRACGLTQLDEDHVEMTGQEAASLIYEPVPNLDATLVQLGKAGPRTIRIETQRSLFPDSPNFFQQHDMDPPWGRNWDIGELRREEIRRMLWTAADICLGGSFVLTRRVVGDLVIAYPQSYKPLVPGQAAISESIIPSLRKPTIWHIYYRTVIILHILEGGTGSIDQIQRDRLRRQIQSMKRLTANFAITRIGDYDWQSNEWLNVACRMLGLKRFLGTEQWLTDQLILLNIFTDPPAGAPKIADMPGTAWTWVIKAMVGMERFADTPDARIEARLFVAFCLKALNDILGNYPCGMLENLLFRVKAGIVKMMGRLPEVEEAKVAWDAKRGVRTGPVPQDGRGLPWKG